MRPADRLSVGLRQLVCLGLVVLCLVSLMPGPARALTAEEKLDDPVLEERARGLSKQLRCLVCQNQSIDDSDAELAKDLRREVRALLQTGASDAEILDKVQNTYGDYVLLKPPVSQQTWLLWLAPVLIVLGGAMIIALTLRRPGPVQADAGDTDNLPDTADPALDGAMPPRTSLPASYIIGAGLVMLAAAGLLYGLYGRPDLPDQPLRERADELQQRRAVIAAETQQLDEAFAAAQDAVTAAPEAMEAWLRLALIAARRGDAAAEIDALQTALKLSSGAPEIKALLAEAMSRAAGGQVTVPARQLIAEILAETPDEPRALFLDGLAAYQDEKFQLAIDRWMYLYERSSADAPWLARLEDSIRRAADDGNLVLPDFAATQQANPQNNPQNNPEGADRADLPEGEQREMIEQMVAGLAARLANEPDDRDGWLRLARSYAVLGRVPEQIDALLAAAARDMSDEGLVIHLAEVILQSGRSERYAARISALLDQLPPAATTNPQWLFFRGHFAASQGDVKRARDSWAKLLAAMPEDSELAQLLQQKIAELPD